MRREQLTGQPVGSIELGQIVSLWPAVAEAIGEENGMLSAAPSAATPTALEADRLTIAFPSDAAFVKKKAEQGRELVAGAVRGLTGHAVSLNFELSDAVTPPAGAATLDHEQAEWAGSGSPGYRPRGALNGAPGARTPANDGH